VDDDESNSFKGNLQLMSRNLTALYKPTIATICSTTHWNAGMGRSISPMVKVLLRSRKLRSTLDRSAAMYLEMRLEPIP